METRWRNNRKRDFRYNKLSEFFKLNLIFDLKKTNFKKYLKPLPIYK
jgi:hypothetical protein